MQISKTKLYRAGGEMTMVRISKDRLSKLIEIINGGECNCEEINIPLCGRCQIQKGIILHMLAEEEEK